MATKRSGSTLRPFVRLDPLGATVHQALVDQLAPTIEARLSRDVFGYRKSLDPADSDPYAGTATWNEFRLQAHALISIGQLFRPRKYVFKSDLTNFFIGWGKV